MHQEYKNQRTWCIQDWESALKVHWQGFLLFAAGTFGEQGWDSGESTRFSPMWPGFESWTRCHMWVEFVVGSRPCFEGFSPGSPVFLSPQKPTLLNFNSIWEPRATGLSVARLFSVTHVKQKVNFILLLFECRFFWFVSERQLQDAAELSGNLSRTPNLH